MRAETEEGRQPEGFPLLIDLLAKNRGMIDVHHFGTRVAHYARCWLEWGSWVGDPQEIEKNVSDRFAITVRAA